MKTGLEHYADATERLTSVDEILQMISDALTAKLYSGNLPDEELGLLHEWVRLDIEAADVHARLAQAWTGFGPSERDEIRQAPADDAARPAGAGGMSASLAVQLADLLGQARDLLLEHFDADTVDLDDLRKDLEVVTRRLERNHERVQELLRLSTLHEASISSVDGPPEGTGAAGSPNPAAPPCCASAGAGA